MGASGGVGGLMRRESGGKWGMAKKQTPPSTTRESLRRACIAQDEEPRILVLQVYDFWNSLGIKPN